MLCFEDKIELHLYLNRKKNLVKADGNTTKIPKYLKKIKAKTYYRSYKI